MRKISQLRLNMFIFRFLSGSFFLLLPMVFAIASPSFTDAKKQQKLSSTSSSKMQLVASRSYSRSRKKSVYNCKNKKCMTECRSMCYQRNKGSLSRKKCVAKRCRKSRVQRKSKKAKRSTHYCKSKKCLRSCKSICHQRNKGSLSRKKCIAKKCSKSKNEKKSRNPKRPGVTYCKSRRCFHKCHRKCRRKYRNRRSRKRCRARRCRRYRRPPRPFVAFNTDLAYKVLVKRYKSIRPKVLKTALDVFSCAWKRRKINRRILTVIDYSLPSDRKRLWVFNLKKRKLLFHEWVSHGKHTGNRWAKSFSNRVNSLKSSLGVFRTSRTYFGRRGYSLRLKGLERGINHRAHYRAIVIHAAGYISHRYLKRKGFMGKSWGCPAVRRTVSHSVIRTIRNGTLVFSYVDSGYYRRQKGRPYYTPARRYSRRRRPRRYAWSSSYLSRWRNKSSYLHCSLK